MSKTSKEVNINIELPLPMDVAGTLLKLIGTAYPDAKMQNNAYGLSFILPEGSRPQEIPDDFEPDTQLDDETNLTRLGPDGIGVSTPQHLASILLSVMKTTFAEYPDAKNYLETKCWDKEDHKGYVMTFQRLEGKSAHEIRQELEAELATVKAELEELKNTKSTSAVLPEKNKRRRISQP